MLKICPVTLLQLLIFIRKNKNEADAKAKIKLRTLFRSNHDLSWL